MAESQDEWIKKFMALRTRKAFRTKYPELFEAVMDAAVEEQAKRDALYQRTMIRVMLGFKEVHTLGVGWAFGLPPKPSKAEWIARANDAFIKKYGAVTELYEVKQ